MKGEQFLLSLPKSVPMLQVQSYIQKYNPHYTASPVVVEGFYTTRINKDVSILYLSTIGKLDIEAQPEGYKGFELSLTCHPLEIDGGDCITIPVDRQTGLSLTGMCVCLGCVAKVVRRAEREKEDVMGEVLRRLSCPARYVAAAGSRPRRSAIVSVNEHAYV